jgi:hypothetical protein
MANPIAQAIQAVGGATQASWICRCSANTIHTWRREGVVRDTRAAVRLARASGISVAALAGLGDESDPDGGTRVEGESRRLSDRYAAFLAALEVAPVAERAAA